VSASAEAMRSAALDGAERPVLQRQPTLSATLRQGRRAKVLEDVGEGVERIRRG
jgi:hypothetical protein